MPLDNATVKERIVLHLNRFPGFGPDEIYNIPFDLTQDGIAEVVGISRAHASLELKKLEDAGKVAFWQAHIKGSDSKRKAYYLLSTGISDATELKIRFESSGILIDSLLDMKRCDPEIMWESLNEKDRESFGIACVFRIPIKREELPKTSTGVIPTSINGLITISDNVKSNYLNVVDPDKIKSWHSFAADWWMGQGDEQERLYHLVMSGRKTEACKLLIKSSEEFLENPNEDLLLTLKNLDAVPKFSESVYTIRSRIAISCKDSEDALKCAERLDDFNSSESTLIRAEVDIITNNAKKAFEEASAIFDCRESARAAIIAAGALLSLERFNDADVFLDAAYKILRDNNDATRMDEILILRAATAYGCGKVDASLSYLNKALRFCRNTSTRDRIDSLIRNLKDDPENVRFRS